MSVKFDASKNNNPFSVGSGSGGDPAMQGRIAKSVAPIGMFAAMGIQPNSAPSVEPGNFSIQS